MLKSTRNAVSFVLACLAIAAIASPASAVVQAGVVGGGIHMQYGPQDAGGNYMGIASESYDFYVDTIMMAPPTGWGDGFPTWSGDQRPPDGIGYGYVLLAFNPYTGEVWNDIPAQHQALNPGGGYYGHAPTVSLSGLDSGGNPIESDVVVADLGRGYAEDCVYITGAFLPNPGGIYLEPFGAFVQTSPDGGILSTTGWPVYAGGAALMQPGDEVRPYAAADPDRPDCYDLGDTGDLTFDQTKTWGSTGFWEWYYGYYAGHNGGVADTLVGFEMDNKKGWMRLDFAGDRTGVRLTEYYFAGLPGDFDDDGDVDDADIDALCDFIRGGLPYDALYDVSGPGEDGVPDGFVDTNDLNYHVHALVQTSVGNGTEYGDFNLDGKVDTTDLTRLATNYGADDWKWDDGNANRHLDTDIDNTDLTILATFYGFGEPDTVPEPATAGLLLTGALVALRRRRRQ